MSQATASEPGQTQTIANVRALLPEISARADEIEQARAVPRDLVEKLRSAGVYRRYVPISHGGEELWPDEAVTVIEDLASADASVAWITAVGSEGAAFYAYLPSATFDKIYSDGPDVIHTGVINATGHAVRDGDGYRFNGQWSFASGSGHADYICVNAILDEPEGAASGGHPGIRFAVIPASDVKIIDTWHVSGLKGTGSNDVVLSDLFVPEEWTGNFAEMPAVRHPLDNRSLLARFGLEFAAVAVGIAQGALNDIVKISRDKIPATAQAKLAADPILQYQLGTLETDHYMAHTLLHQVARDDQASALSGTPDQNAMVIRKARLSRIASVSASVVEGCYGLSGTTGLFESCALQRRMRDVRAVTQHYMLSARTAFGAAGGAVLETWG